MTLTLDAMPFLPMIYSELRKLPDEIIWNWVVCEGTALPTNCTKWCAQLKPRLSNDGTTEYLESVTQFDKRVLHLFNNAWNGKISMVNAALRAPSLNHHDEYLLWQMDSDEIFDSEQIEDCWMMFERIPQRNAAFFWCRYFVGPDKVIVTRNCFGNNPEYEWHRVWKVKPGMLFRTHEPPVIEGLKLNPFTHAETEARGLVFQHYAYATRSQVAFKQEFYAGQKNPNARHYRGLVERWEKFQNQTSWPRPLKEMMPWAEPHVMVDKI